MFGHVTGNDPRPHYAHQSNLAAWNAGLPETDPLQGGILYPYLDNILGYYRSLYADNAPITQLTPTGISAALTQQQAWAANVAAGRVSGYIQDDKMHIITTTAMSVPVTGTTQGDTYAGTKSTWLPVAAGETILNLKDPIVNPTAPVTVDVPGRDAAEAGRPVAVQAHPEGQAGRAPGAEPAQDEHPQVRGRPQGAQGEPVELEDHAGSSTASRPSGSSSSARWSSRARRRPG